jgi:hypothetical protein
LDPRINPPRLVSSDGRVAYMSWDVTGLAQLTTLPVAGGLSVATGPSFDNGLIGIQVGAKVFELSQHGPVECLLALSGGRRNLFFLVSLSTNLRVGAHQQVPLKLVSSRRHLQTMSAFDHLHRAAIRRAQRTVMTGSCSSVHHAV